MEAFLAAFVREVVHRARTGHMGVDRRMATGVFRVEAGRKTGRKVGNKVGIRASHETSYK